MNISVHVGFIIFIVQRQHTLKGAHESDTDICGDNKSFVLLENKKSLLCSSPVLFQYYQPRCAQNTEELASLEYFKIIPPA